MYIFAGDSSLIATLFQDDMLLNIIDKIKSGETSGDLNYKEGSDSLVVAAIGLSQEHVAGAMLSYDSEENIYENRPQKYAHLRSDMYHLRFNHQLLAFINYSQCQTSVICRRDAIIQLNNLKLEKEQTSYTLVNTKSESGKIASCNEFFI